MKKCYESLFYMLICFFNIFSNKKNVISIFYHGVSIEDEPLCIKLVVFKEQIEYLISKEYYFATSEEIAKYINGEIDLPDKTVNISFDDGFENIYLNAFPFLKESDIPFTVFLNTGFIEKELYHKEAFCLAPKENINVKCKFLSIDQIFEMLGQGVSFHNHTHTHIDLLSDKSMLDKREDINKCHETLLNKFKINSRHFSYPFGFLNKDVLKYLKEIKYFAGWGIDECLINHKTDMFFIPRAPITNMSLTRFKIIMSNYSHLYKKTLSVLKSVLK